MRMKWYCFVFLYYNVCVVKCHSIAMSEIEDFSNFLKETSQLDQNVKSSYPGTDYDDEESISDDAWEESGKFEGDLILNERQRRLIVANVAEGLARNGLTDTTKRWPNNEVVYFIQREHFTSDQIEAIQSGIDDLARVSCVKFTPYRKGDRDAVVIQGSRRGCFSQVGYQGGYQVLNLSGRHPVGRGCFRHGTVVHELLHTLGFYHMQSSHDRDDYIDVIWENIVKPARHNFRKYNSFSVSDFGVGYDYDSVLHYSKKAFSSNGQDTIVPKQSGSSIGQRIGLSDKDTQKLNKMYCDADSDLLDENTEPKKPATKKKGKNRPFEGHGIGYQQGKTVIIKQPVNQQGKVALLPQIMYHFSSAPKTMQATAFVQGIGAGKEVSYDYHPMTSSIQKDSMAFVNLPNLQNNQHSRDPEISKIHTTGNVETSDDDEGLNEALHRFANAIKTHAYPYPTFDYDYSKYMNHKKVHEKPNMLNDKSMHYIHSVADGENFNSRFTIDDRPTHITQEKTNQFYSLGPKEISQELRLPDHSVKTDSIELVEQRNYEYAPTNEPIGLQNHSYSNVYDPEQQSGIKSISQMKGLIQIKESYREDNEKIEPNNNKSFIYENSNLNNYPSIQNTHITAREPYTLPYSYSVPVGNTWYNGKTPNHEYYKNKYPDSAEVYR